MTKGNVPLTILEPSSNKQQMPGVMPSPKGGEATTFPGGQWRPSVGSSSVFCNVCGCHSRSHQELCNLLCKNLPLLLFFHFRHGRAVRCVLERGEDMLITGGRHPYLAKYKVSQRWVEGGICYKPNMTETQRAAFIYSLMGNNNEQMALLFNFLYLVMIV